MLAEVYILKVFIVFHPLSTTDFENIIWMCSIISYYIFITLRVRLSLECSIKLYRAIIHNLGKG
jgi:hypothetical protein